ncbi:GDSL-type esterase/lipase family protein [Robertkochia sediminum]|uniref:GDSL-type esterase/lipase family protein n=1 Tax=Robertkochia sediminum TaxID=2785326 RepID=UPI0019331D40|nr:GDSL-type esterase/lipase family protein [Robertkochia sediminum]MBL7473261.1 hypothetical protein [Robertkochia sediminum]
MNIAIPIKNRIHLLAVICSLLIPFLGNAQKETVSGVAREVQKNYSDHYYQRLELFQGEDVAPGAIVFLGNSITEGGNWKALFPKRPVVNRGISGDVTDGILNRIGEVTALQPDKIFLLVGTNDLARGKRVEYVVSGVKAIVEALQQASADTRIYVQSILPVNPMVGDRFSGHKANSQKILEANARLEQLAKAMAVEFIDLHKAMRDRKGYLKAGYTYDGLHLSEAGYVRWKQVVKKQLK